MSSVLRFSTTYYSIKTKVVPLHRFKNSSEFSENSVNGCEMQMNCSELLGGGNDDRS